MKELKKERVLTLKTKSGCWRLLYLFLAIILVSSLFGRLVQSDFGTIKVEQVTIDARGAEINGELYYPAGTTSHDKLPAVVLAHGGGNTYGVFKGIASELARRGFVVLNESAYGSGISTMPAYEESDQGVKGRDADTNPAGVVDATENIKGFDVNTTPLGVLDSANFVRSLTFVDKTRVGVAGHSMGATRTNATVIMDCGYLSFNDTMINVLYNTFGQKFTQDEINQPADKLAEARLNADQLKYYDSIRDTNKTAFDSKIKSAIVLGDTADVYFNTVKVNVGGYDVQRETQTNMALMGGGRDWCYATSTNDTAKASFYSKDDLLMGSWYDVNSVSASSSIVGTLNNSSIVSDKALADAIDDRSTRLFHLSGLETHSQDFFSNETISAIVKYFEQTLDYNRGDLASASTIPLDANNNIWGWGALFNLTAMISMFGMLIALCGLLLKTTYFAPCVCEDLDEKRLHVSNKVYWIFGIVTVGLGFLAICFTNNNGLFFINPSDFLPLTRGASLTCVLLGCMAIVAIIVMIGLAAINKKKNGITGLGALNIGIKFKNIAKSILLALLLLVAAYSSLSVIDYFFGQDYRFWVVIFTYMKADMWLVAIRYIFIFPFVLIVGAGINYTVRKDIPEWKDTLNTVVINSAGIWLCCLVETLILIFGKFNLTFFSGVLGFTCSYQILFIVPLTVYIARKMYNLTKSIWVGSMLNTLIILWSLTSALGVNDFYCAQTWLGNFLNF